MQSCSFCHMIGHSIPECCVRSPCKRCHSEDHCYLSCEETGDDELVEIVDSFPDLYMICLPTTDGTYSWMQRYIQIKDNRMVFPDANSEIILEYDEITMGEAPALDQEPDEPSPDDNSNESAPVNETDDTTMPEAPSLPTPVRAAKATKEAIKGLPKAKPTELKVAKYVKLLANTRTPSPSTVNSYSSAAMLKSSRVTKPPSRVLESNFRTAVAVITGLRSQALQKQSPAAAGISQQ
ncbi:unnamed protein product [Ambrosiozyma monospora]|uniref:Unnamed protein product n=1 Tax=Ambrosiozyma monospora TaxID=43982 RepID=A0A9W6SZQ7_AMBMO|nr:unnamed protein product [Ambrosiozyma monospora]